MAFDKPFDWLQVFSHFDNYAKEAIFELLLRSLCESCSFSNWHCVHVYIVILLVCLEVFVPVRDWWLSYELPRLIFVSTTIFTVHYWNLVTIGPTPELSIRIAISEISVFAVVSFNL